MAGLDGRLCTEVVFGFFQGLTDDLFPQLCLLANPSEVFGKVVVELSGNFSSGFADFPDDGIGVHGISAENGFFTVTPGKSEVFLVTTVRPYARDVAAMRLSITGTERPSEWRRLQ